MKSMKKKYNLFWILIISVVVLLSLIYLINVYKSERTLDGMGTDWINGIGDVAFRYTQSNYVLQKGDGNIPFGKVNVSKGNLEISFIFQGNLIQDYVYTSKLNKSGVLVIKGIKQSDNFAYGKGLYKFDILISKSNIDSKKVKRVELLQVYESDGKNIEELKIGVDF